MQAPELWVFFLSIPLSTIVQKTGYCQEQLPTAHFFLCHFDIFTELAVLLPA